MDLIDALRLEPDANSVVALVGGGGKTKLLFRLVEEAAARGMRPIATTTTRLGAEQVAHDPALVEVTGETLPWSELAHTLDTHSRALVVGPRRADKRPGLAPNAVEHLLTHAPPLGIGLIVVEADGSHMLPVKAPADHEPVVPACTTHLLAVTGVDAIGRRVVAGQVHRPERVRAVLGLGDDATVRLTPAMVAALALHPEGGAKAVPGGFPGAAGATLVPILNKVERAHEVALARLVARDWAAAGQLGLITAAAQAEQPVVERWAAWAVVVLAAGESRRMGRAKQLLPVAGEPMARRAVCTALASGAQQVVLVTGAYAEAVAATVADLADADPRLRIVHNAGWESGQAGSLQTGLAAVAPTIQAAVILPVDQPFVPAALLRRLVAAWREGAPLAAAAVDGELRGVPALFDRSFWAALQAVQGDIGGRMVLRANLARVAHVAAPAAWLADIDTPADLP